MSNKKEHKKVQVVVIDTARSPFQLLLLQTKEDRQCIWQNITGSVDEGETFHKAALRELKEETGLRADSLIDLDLSYEYHDRWDRDVHEQVYLCKLSFTPEKIDLSEEHQDYKWVSVESVQEQTYRYPSNFESFKKALERSSH